MGWAKRQRLDWPKLSLTSQLQPSRRRVEKEDKRKSSANYYRTLQAGHVSVEPYRRTRLNSTQSDLGPLFSFPVPFPIQCQGRDENARDSTTNTDTAEEDATTYTVARPPLRSVVASVRVMSMVE